MDFNFNILPPSEREGKEPSKLSRRDFGRNSSIVSGVSKKLKQGNFISGDDNHVAEAKTPFENSKSGSVDGGNSKSRLFTQESAKTTFK